MGQATGYSLVMPEHRRPIFLEYAGLKIDFAEPVEEFEHSRTSPLICFVLSSPGTITHLAIGKRGMRAGTDIRRLNLKSIEELTVPISTETLISKIPYRFRSAAKSRFLGGGIFPQKTFTAVIDTITELFPEMRPFLDRYGSIRVERIRRLSDSVKESLAYQQQSVATALLLAGMDRVEFLQEWSPPVRETPKSFLDGLPSVRLREDPMVVNDLMRVPGFSLVRTLPYNAAIFESQLDRLRLTVILANRLPLEEQTGADLIYYNETYKSFVMVQYKAMEFQQKKGAIFRLPSAQLKEEIIRMDHLMKIINEYAPKNDRDDFRLSENPFFIKLCPRIVFQPDDVGLVPGMYLPLDYWKLLVRHHTVKTRRGGFQVTYDNVGRHFDNTEFVKIVAKAWVGTNSNQSSILEAVFQKTLESGKAVVLAIKISF